MSKTVAIIPSTITKEDAELLRAQRAADCFWHLLAAAKSQIDGVNWHQLGLHEAEAAMHAWERGEQHAFFRTWEARKATVGANRPAPTAVELEARRWVLLMCRALERTGLGRKAKKLSLSSLAEIGASAMYDIRSSHRTVLRRPAINIVAILMHGIGVLTWTM